MDKVKIKLSQDSLLNLYKYFEWLIATDYMLVFNNTEKIVLCELSNILRHGYYMESKSIKMNYSQAYVIFNAYHLIDGLVCNNPGLRIFTNEFFQRIEEQTIKKTEVGFNILKDLNNG